MEVHLFTFFQIFQSCSKCLFLWALGVVIVSFWFHSLILWKSIFAYSKVSATDLPEGANPCVKSTKKTIDQRLKIALFHFELS